MNRLERGVNTKHLRTTRALMKAPGAQGIVKSINFRSSMLVRLDLSLVEVPNAHFLHAAVVNVSRQSTFRHEFVMPLSMTTGSGRPLTHSLTRFIRSTLYPKKRKKTA